MKLCVFLMLAAIPLCCHAGSGCQILEDLIAMEADPAVSMEEFLKAAEPFITLSSTREVVAQERQCFLDQSNETQANVRVMMDIIYNSDYCAGW